MIFLICATYSESLLERLGHWNVLTGLILAVVGFILSVSAFAIVRAIKKSVPDKYGKGVIILKITGLVMVIAGFVLAMFDM